MKQVSIFALSIACINLIGGALAVYLGAQTQSLALVAWGIMQASVAGLVWMLRDEYESEIKELKIEYQEKSS